jgi:ubiquinone/menaquinone biosynthesis C-methylase UbiE
LTLGQRIARVITDAVIHQPRLWPVFRRIVERQFDSLAPQWDSMRSEDSFAAFEAALDSVAGPVSDALDLGTGTGEGAARIVRRFPDARVVGVDLSEQMLDLARQKVPEAEFQRADASALPFADASFDLVTLANMVPFFDELLRVLRPDGTVLFSFSIGADTPIYVPPERLRAELAERGFVDFADFAAGRSTALTSRKR